MEYSFQNQWNKTLNPETNPQLYGQLIFNKGGNIMQWKKDSYMLKNETGPLSNIIHKDKLEMH